MNEISARDILLLRAFESSGTDARWSDADRAWANQTALEQSSGSAQPGALGFIARRAALATERLKSRDPAIGRVLRAVSWRPFVGPLIVGAAFALGLLTDLIGPDKKVNLLAPPLLGIIAWNLLVYCLMLATTVLRTGPGSGGPLNRLVAWIAVRAGSIDRLTSAPAMTDGAANAPASDPGVLPTFVREWLAASQPLTMARSAAILHFAAAAFAVGAIAALYFRGLGLAYLAGWESTFLDAAGVKSLLDTLFAPASWLAGITLPDASGYAAMAFANGDGVNAAPWIHLYALTMVLIVIVPRCIMATTAALTATRLASRFALDTDSPYFESLARIERGDAARLAVLPYSYRLPDNNPDNLKRLLGHVHGADAQITIHAPVQPGDEDNLMLPIDAVAPAIMVALFAMTATPEKETHGLFVRHLRSQLAPATVLLALVDEARFRQRFGQQTGRLEQRRNAWRKVLADAGLNALFVDLSASVSTATEQSVLDVVRAAQAGQSGTHIEPEAKAVVSDSVGPT